MPYFTITDFAAGMDVRRSTLTAPAGTLRSVLNAHISPGGEIEKRYAFKKIATVPANTKGLVSVNQHLYVFGPMTAAETARLHPTPRLNSHAYAVNDTIVVASNPSRIFTCIGAGTTAATEPAQYAIALDSQVVDTDGTALFQASTPEGWTSDISPPFHPDRINSHDYGADTIRVASNPDLIFICRVPGTSAETEPAAYATATAGATITDGTATFIASAVTTAARANAHIYSTDVIRVASNPNRVFICIKPGTSAGTEPPAYAAALDNQLVIDGSAIFRSGTADNYVERVDNHFYNVNDVVNTPTNPERIFTCTTSGTSADGEPLAFASAVQGTVVNDGTAMFRCSVPIAPYAARVGPHTYVVDDVVTTTLNRSRIFTCITAGTTASIEPGAAYAGAVDGSTVNDGTAVFRASTPSYPTRINSQAYTADVIAVASNPTRIFVCAIRGKSAASEPAAYASAGDNVQVVDGTAIFLASAPIYTIRDNSHAYDVDIIVVPSNPTRIFTCTTTLGTSAAAEPAGYATALDGSTVTDGTVSFLASTPPAQWVIDGQPPITPIKTEPVGMWDIGILPIESETLFEIVDYDLFDKKVFVVAWTDASKGSVVRCYDGRSVPEATGFFIKTYKTKIYAVAGSVLSFSAIANPFDWTGTGSGSIDLSLEDSDMTDCLALEAYYDKLAIISKTATQLWLIDPDPLKNQYVQTLKDAGTVAWRSVLQYGSGDVMYLAPSGVRSLRARNSSLAAAVSDIGSPLDPILQMLFRTRGEEAFASTIALLQPISGRFWVIMDDRIYVLSAFPGPKVTAWSQYDPLFIEEGSGEPVPFRTAAATTHRHRVVLRDENNNIYVYAGIDPTGPIFDTCPVELVFPFHAGDQPATFKQFQAINAAATGQWEVSLALNPDDETVEDFAGVLQGQNFTHGDFPIDAYASHMSLRLRAFEPGPATLSNLIVHYSLGPPRGIGT